MFDIGFSEIVVIAVVALVVIGPERLPKTARTLGLLFGRLQRYVNDVKADISREMELDELRKLQREMQGAARDFEQTVTTAASDVATGVRNVERELNDAPAATPAGHPSAGQPSAGQPSAAPTAEAPSARQAALPGFDKI
jgi:sec-independent protein translocase protein TatB